MSLTAQVKACVASGLYRLDDINAVTQADWTVSELEAFGFRHIYGRFFYPELREDEKLRPDYSELQARRERWSNYKNGKGAMPH